MQDLNYSLKQPCRRNCSGSLAMRSDQDRVLVLIANQLCEVGSPRMDAHSLKPTLGTIKDHMGALRWWAEKTGTQNAVAPTNAGGQIVSVCCGR